MYSSEPQSNTDIARIFPKTTDLLKSKDWSDTPLGAIEYWPDALRTCISLMLDSPMAMAIMWGFNDSTLLYNDAYAVIAAERHPAIFGAKVKDAWPEAWELNAHVLQTCAAGNSLSYRDQSVPLQRNGHLQELYFSLDYSPIRDTDGCPRGVAAFVSETTDKVRAVHRVNTERARLAQMFEQAPGFMALLHGPDHVFDLANPAYLQLVGNRDILGKTVKAALPEIADQGFLEILDDVYRSGKTFTAYGMSALLQRSSGEGLTRRYVDLVYHPLNDSQGHPAGIFVQGADVTERVRAETEAKLREQQFRVLATSLPSQVWSADKSGRLEWVNQHTCEFSGLTEAQLIGLGWTQIVHPDDLPLALLRWEAAVMSGSEYEVEFRLRRHDGSFRWHLSRAVAVCETQDVAFRWLGSNTDIEEQRAGAQLLAESNEHLQELLAERTADRDRMWQLSPDVMLVADFEGAILSTNPAWKTLLGWEAHELEGRTFLEFVHPDDLPATLHEMAQLSEGRTTFRFENRYRQKSGDYCTLMWAAVPASQLIHAVGRDVTADRQAQEALRKTEAALFQAQKMESVGQLTGGVAHDFNNVLQIVGGNLALLKPMVLHDDVASKRLASAQAGIQRGARLASHLLAFARRQPLSPAVISVGKLLRGLDDMLRRALGEAIELRTVVADDLGRSLVDAAFLENALLNLAINARDAMEGIGKLTVEASNASLDHAYAHGDVEPGEYVVIAVTDTGCGMDAALLARIFEPFFTTKSEGKGTGLGLSMVYGFVKQSGGHVRVYSEVGVGTTIKLYLKRSLEPETAVVPQEPLPPQGGQETILVVEDDPQVREIAVDMLRDLGYQVLHAADARAGLAILQGSVSIDLLFTDVVMPGDLKSKELARRGKLLRSDMAVLFTSGYTESAISRGGTLDPGITLLSKPYSRDELARTVKRVLSQARRPPSQATAVPAASDETRPLLVTLPPTALRVLVVEDNEDALYALIELIRSIGHLPEGVASGDLALEQLRETSFDVVLTDMHLPGLSGLNLVDHIAAQAPNTAVIIASGAPPPPPLPRTVVKALLKPFGMEELEAAFAQCSPSVRC